MQASRGRSFISTSIKYQPSGEPDVLLEVREDGVLQVVEHFAVGQRGAVVAGEGADEFPEGIGQHVPGRLALRHLAVALLADVVPEERLALQRVDDVHAFPGHIACDAASVSELVVPIVRDGKLIAVLDLDSPNPSRFTEEDEAGCVKLAEILAKAL